MRKIYEYEDWFRHPRTELIRGRDYNVNQSAMSQMVRNFASQQKVRVSVLDVEDRIIIWVAASSLASTQGSTEDLPQLHPMAS